MRAEFTLAMRRESSELERELVDQRVDEAFEQVYDYLEPAATYLRTICDSEGRRALEHLERAYLRALEIAARSGIGLRPRLKGDEIPQRRTVIPAAPAPDPSGDDAALHAASLEDTDRVLCVTPCR